MDDAAGDTISGEPDAPTLQEAVNAAAKAENGGTLVTLPETTPIVGDTLRLQS